MQLKPEELPNALRDYILRWRGLAKPHPHYPRTIPSFHILIWSFIAAFCGIAATALLTYHAPALRDHGLSAQIGSFGASAVLIYGSVESPFAQPRNVIGGHLLSAFAGVTVRLLVVDVPQNSGYKPGHELDAVPVSIEDAGLPADDLRWLACGLAVAFAILLMQVCRMVHPPGGATALIAVTGGPEIYKLGYLYLLIPVLFGLVVLVFAALLVNNLRRQYPHYWWSPPLAEPGVDDEVDMTADMSAIFDPQNRPEDRLARSSLRGIRTDFSNHRSASRKGGSSHRSAVSHPSALDWLTRFEGDAGFSLQTMTREQLASTCHKMHSVMEQLNAEMRRRANDVSINDITAWPLQ